MDSSLNQRYKLDVESLLRTVSALEAQLSEQARSTTIPFWATELMERITVLEQDNEKLERKVKELSSKPLKTTVVSADLESRSNPNDINVINQLSHENENKLIEKIRGEYENHIQSIKNTMELKMTSLNIEIDRAYKLLQSRPTTTDFQHVAYQIQALETKVHENINEFSISMKSNIQDNISKEMSNLVVQLKNNEALNESNFGLIFNKFDVQWKEVEEMRKNITVFTEYVKDHFSDITSKSSEINDIMASCNVRLESELTTIKDSIKEFYVQQQSAIENYSDIRATMSRRLLMVEEMIAKQDATQTEALQMLEGKLNKTNELFQHMEEEFKYLGLKTENESNKMFENLLSQKELISELDEHIKTIDDDIDAIDNQLGTNTTKFITMENHLTFNTTKIEEAYKKMEALDLLLDNKIKVINNFDEKINKMDNSLLSTNNRMHEILATYDNQSRQLAAIHLNSKQLDDDLHKLGLIWEETSALRELCKVNDEHNTQHHGIISKLNETLNELKLKSDEIENICNTTNLKHEGDIQVLNEFMNDMKDMRNIKELIHNEILTDMNNMKFKMESMTSSIDTLHSNHVIHPLSHLNSMHDHRQHMSSSRMISPPTSPKAATQSNSKQSSTSSSSSSNNNTSVSNNHSSSNNQNTSTSSKNNQKHKSSNNNSNNNNNNNNPSSSSNASANVNTSVIKNSVENDENNISPALREESSVKIVSRPVSSRPVTAAVVSTVRQLSEEEELANDVQTLIEQCMSFEDQSVQRSLVLELSVKMSETITILSQRQAMAIAKSSDIEVVKQALSNEDTSGIDNAVSNIRQEKVLQLLESIKESVVRRHPHPGVIRLDAREKFFKKVKLAVDMWLSKYDQVLVIGNSRLGRVKIPSCIACDRPLLRKELRDESQTLPALGRSNTPPERQEFHRREGLSTSQSMDQMRSYVNGNVRSNNLNNNNSNINSNLPGRSSSLSNRELDSMTVAKVGYKIPKITTHLPKE